MQGSFFTYSFQFAYIKLSCIHKVVNICFSEKIRIAVYGLFYYFVAAEVLITAENVVVTIAKNATAVTMVKKMTANVMNQDAGVMTAGTTSTKFSKV